MSYLTRRVEQAFLGAILASGTESEIGSNVDYLAGLAPDDFGHGVHRQLFEALSELSTQQPTLSGDELITAVAERLDAPGTEREWLTRLRSAADRVENRANYAGMIRTGSLRRELAVHSQRIAETKPGPLAAALQRNIRIHRMLTGDASPDFQSASAAEEQHPPPVKAAVAEEGAALNLEPGPGEGTRSRVRYEELLIADLLQNPEQVHDIERVLTGDNFASEQLRDLYNVIVEIHERGIPVDEVTVAWHVEQERAARALADGEERESQAIEGKAALAYVDRLAIMSPSTPAVETARLLIAEDLREGLRTHAELQHDPTPNVEVRPRPAAPDALRPPVSPGPATPDPRIKP